MHTHSLSPWQFIRVSPCSLILFCLIFSRLLSVSPPTNHQVSYRSFVGDSISLTLQAWALTLTNDMPGPPALRRGGEKLDVKKKEGMWLGGQTPGCILVRFELSEATRERQGENSILYQTDRMFLGNKDHNLNNVKVCELSAGNAGLWNMWQKKGIGFVSTVYKISFRFVFWSSWKNEKRN